MTINRLAIELQQPIAPEEPPNRIPGGPVGTAPARGGAGLEADRMLLGALVAVLAIAALPDGIAPSWLSELLTVACGALALLMAGLGATGRRTDALPLGRLAPSGVLMALLFAWILAQALSLPWFLSASWQHPLWRLAADALPGRLAASISIDPAAGLSGCSILLRDSAMVWIAFQLAATSQRSRQMLLAIVLIGAGHTAGALLERLAHRPAGADALPAVAGLSLLALLALQIGGPRTVLPRPVIGPMQGWPRLQNFLFWSWWGSLGALLFATALLLPRGLSGLIAALVGLLGFLAAMAACPALSQFRHRLRFALGLALVIGALLVGLSLAAERVNAARAADPGSTTIYEIAAQAIADAPLLGAGYRSFGSVAHLYGADPGTAALSPGFYLKAMAELGVPGGMTLVLACAGLFVICARGVRWRRRNAIYPCLGIGATALAASDAAVSVSLHNPLAALVWCTIMGIACAQSLPTAERYRSGAAT